MCLLSDILSLALKFSIAEIYEYLYEYLIFGNELQKQRTLRPCEQIDCNRKWPLKSILRGTMLTTIRDEYQVT